MNDINNMFKSMTKDLMTAEYFINNIDIETRLNKNEDKFRNIYDILKTYQNCINLILLLSMIRKNF